MTSFVFFPYNSTVANVGDGWFAATGKSDYIQAIGLSSAKFQHLPPQKYPVTFPFQELHHVMFEG